MRREKKERVIFSISLPPEVADRLDKWTQKKNLNRSQSISMMVSAYMDSEEARPQMLQMAEGMGALMQNLFQMTPEEIKQRLAGAEEQLEAMPESLKEGMKNG